MNISLTYKSQTKISILEESEQHILAMSTTTTNEGLRIIIFFLFVFTFYLLRDCFGYSNKKKNVFFFLFFQHQTLLIFRDK